MSFRATLKIDGKELRVLHCNYGLQRDTDATGRPASDVRGGTIQMEVESSGDNSFFEWIVDRYSTKNGSIKFFKRDEDAAMREVQFEEAYLVGYSESIDAIGSNPMTTNLTISARKITVGGASHVNPWPNK